MKIDTQVISGSIPTDVKQDNKAEAKSSDIKPGDIIEAKLISVENGMVNLETSDGKFFQAKIPTNMIAESLMFLVKDVGKDTLTLGILEQTEKGDEALEGKVKEILSKLNLPSTGVHIDIAKEMIKSNLPVTKESISNILSDARALDTFSQIPKERLTDIFTNKQASIDLHIKSFLAISLSRGYLEATETQNSKTISTSISSQSTLVSETKSDIVEFSEHTQRPSNDSKINPFEISKDITHQDKEKLSILKEQEIKLESSEQSVKQEFSQFVKKALFFKTNGIELTFKNMLGDRDLFSKGEAVKLIEQVVSQIADGHKNKSVLSILSGLRQESDDIKSIELIKGLKELLIEEVTSSKDAIENRDDISRLRGVLDLQRALQNNYDYYFVPYQTKEIIKDGHIFIHKRNKKQSIDADNTSAFVSFDTVNMGTVDGKIVIQSKKMDVELIFEEDFYVSFAEKYVSELKDMLNSSYYSLSRLAVRTKSKGETLFDSLRLTKNDSVNMLDLRV